MVTQAPEPASALSDLARGMLEALKAEQAKQVGFKHDASGVPIEVGYSHGDGGNFRLPGTDPQMFHTIVGNRGILGQLPVTATTNTDPTYAIVTGVTDTTGDEPDLVCDIAPVAGLMKNCVTTAPFGRYSRRTQEVQLGRLGKTSDRHDPMDLRMVGSPIAQSGLFLQTGPAGIAQGVPGDVFSNEIRRKFWELGTALHRLISQQLFIGSTANNLGGGGYSEINGFERLIATGHQDVLTGIACPAVDSQLLDMNYASVDSSGTDIVDALTYLYRYARNLAFRTGVNPVRWVLAMREELFYEITAIWPCAYLTYRCSLVGNERLNIDGSEQVAMTQRMRDGNFLLIDGAQVEVVLDDGITADTPTTDANVTEGCSASDIFLIPMSISGGVAVTYLEHFDYGNPSLTTALADTKVNAAVDGPWLTTLDQTRTCVAWQTEIEPRLVMRTPWLAARLQNVMFCPTLNTRQPFPDDPYYINGGQTTRPGPSYYPLWA